LRKFWAFTDRAFTDRAFTDRAFTDRAFTDRAFDEECECCADAVGEIFGELRVH
jgi:hypothetical protein